MKQERVSPAEDKDRSVTQGRTAVDAIAFHGTGLIGAYLIAFSKCCLWP